MTPDHTPVQSRHASPVRVNDDGKGNKRAQPFTWLAVDPTDGSVNVAFLDRRDTDGTFNAVTLARSVDGGKALVDHGVNRPPLPSREGVFYGDYPGVDAHGGNLRHYRRAVKRCCAIPTAASWVVVSTIPPFWPVSFENFTSANALAVGTSRTGAINASAIL